MGHARQLQSLNVDELYAIADILMGAAHADGDYDGAEADAISDILKDLVGAALVPMDLRDRLGEFDDRTFDLTEAAGRLHLAGADDRKALLGLVAKVTDADDVHDMREDAYLRKVATAIGADDGELDGLTVEVTFISSLQPPPLPPG